jgi:branched-subunit amino acid aminotransferase/4-amino-4-deoxychorismate lyase
VEVVQGVGHTRDQTLYVPRHFDIDSNFYFAFFWSLLGTKDGPLSLDPSSTVFHYAQCLFEGLKAYRNKNGRVTLFRPDLNMERMNRSAQRLALPVSVALRASCHGAFDIDCLSKKTFNGAAFLDLIKVLVRLERDWIPQENGYSLYIRPVLSVSHRLSVSFLTYSPLSRHSKYHRHFTS